MNWNFRENIHMINVGEQPKTWRDNWFIKNVFSEIPVVGGIFQTAQLGHVASYAVKSSFMLLGGTTVMMLNLLGIDENDNPGVTFAKMTGGMAIGMTAGVVLYNSLFSAGKKSVEVCKKRCRQEPQDSAEQPLPLHPTTYESLSQ